MGTSMAARVASVCPGSRVPELKMPKAVTRSSWFMAYASVPPQLIPAAAMCALSMLAQLPWPAFCVAQSIASVIIWGLVPPPAPPGTPEAMTRMPHAASSSRKGPWPPTGSSLQAPLPQTTTGMLSKLLKSSGWKSVWLGSESST